MTIAVAAASSGTRTGQWRVPTPRAISSERAGAGAEPVPAIPKHFEASAQPCGIRQVPDGLLVPTQWRKPDFPTDALSAHARVPLVRRSWFNGTVGRRVRQDVPVPNRRHGDLFRTRPAADGPGFEVVFSDARTGEERVLGVVDGPAQAQAFIAGAIAAVEASGAYARGYEAGLTLKRESPAD